MNLELAIVPLLLVSSLLLLFLNFRTAIYVLLILSVLLHKELFSIYRWDLLPVRVFMLGVLIYAIWELFKIFRRKGLKSILRDPFILLLGLMWLINGISIVNSKNLVSSVGLFGFFTTIVALGSLLYLKFKTDQHAALNYVKAYIFVLFVACLFGVLQIYIHSKTDTVIGALWPVPGHTPRVGSTFWDVNHFGGLLAMLLPVSSVLVLVEKGIKNKLVFLITSGLMAAILLLTNSRTAWIAGGVAFVTFVSFLVYRRFRLKGILVILVAAFLLSLPLVGEYMDKASPFRAKIKDYFHYRIDSFDSHILLLRGTFEVFELFPVIGGGYGGFFEHFANTKVSTIYFGRDPAALNTRVPAHTIWGELLAETGVLGLSAFLLFTALVLGTLFYAAFTLNDRRQVLITTAMGSALVGILTAGVFYSYKTEFFWLVLFLYFVYAVSLLKDNFNIGAIASYLYGRRVLHLLVLTILGLFLIFINLGSTKFIPWDEAIYAKIAKNMVETGEYIEMHWWPVKAYLDKLWFEKPPLYMWFMSGFMAIFGVNEWSARLPSAIFGLATVILIYFFATRLFNKAAGLLSAFALLTTFQFLYYSRTAMLDVTVTFFITLSLYLYWLAKQCEQQSGQQDRPQSNSLNESTKNFTKNATVLWVLSGASIGFAVMTKGIIGFLPFPIIFLYEIYLYKFGTQRFDSKKVANYLIFAISSAIVFLPWHVEMYRRFGRQFIDTYIGYHVLARATESIEDKGRPIYWYLIVLKVSMRIWFVLLLAAFPFNLFISYVSSIKKLAQKMLFPYDPKAHVFLTVTALTLFVFFSSAESKVVWYIIPLYPILAIMVGQFLERVITSGSAYLVNSKYFSRFALDQRVLRFLAVFIIFIFGLFYLALNKKLVYPGDLTGKQVGLIEQKNKLFGDSTLLYADRIELPLLFFYTDGPFQVTDFTPLKETFATALPGQSFVFITKESRFRQFRDMHPDKISLVAQDDEWVLGSFVAENGEQ